MGELKGRSLGELKGRSLGELKGRSLGELKGRSLGELKGRSLGELKGRSLGELKGHRHHEGEHCAWCCIDSAVGVLISFLSANQLNGILYLLCFHFSRLLKLKLSWCRKSALLTARS